jgi:hypothetical protein
MQGRSAPLHPDLKHPQQKEYYRAVNKLRALSGRAEEQARRLRVHADTMRGRGLHYLWNSADPLSSAMTRAAELTRVLHPHHFVKEEYETGDRSLTGDDRRAMEEEIAKSRREMNKVRWDLDRYSTLQKNVRLF